MPGTLSPDVVGPLLRGRFGRPFLHAPSCDSTQHLLDPGLPEGALAVCEEQAAGRGRLGRSWHAPRGEAILCSVLLRPAADHTAAELTLVGGLAAALTVERALGREAEVKWPNDVLVDGGKVAGILAESRDGAVVLGVGMNVNQSASGLPAGARTAPASLRTVGGRELERAPILAELLVQLERLYDSWSADGLAPLVGELAARDALRGRRVSVGAIAGVAAGLAADGRLVVATDHGELLVASGEVTVGPALPGR